MNDKQNKSSSVIRLKELVRSGTYAEIQTLIDELKPPDLAHLLESSPQNQRIVLWNLLGEESQSEVIQQVDEDMVPLLLGDKTTEEIVSVLENVEFDDDLTDILQHLPGTLTQQVLEAMDFQDRSRVENLLSYPEDTAGGLMATDIISVRARVTLEVVVRYLRRLSALPPLTDAIMVVSHDDRFEGLLPLATLLISDRSLTVREVMVQQVETIAPDTPEREVAAMFHRYDLVSAPVVDDQNRLLGRITIDDVVDVIVDEADHSLLGMAGLDNDTFAPILKTARSRAIWLGANLLTAFLAASVIDLFKDTIAQVVALAVLMPVVASMGGVAGSQTLTLVIRNMVQDDLFQTNLFWLARRELAVGILNGLLWALVVAVVATLVFQDYILGFVIAVALPINMITAALAGALLPSLLRSLGIDPAIAGTVVLTTITDVVGFLSFLGLATLVYA